MYKTLATFFLLNGLLFAPLSYADDNDTSYHDAIKSFKAASETHSFFKSAYGYAEFPSIGKVGLGIGGAHGNGQVYHAGKLSGKTSMTQLSIGFQVGGQAFSQIIFLKDKRAYDDFTSGNFEFAAGVSAVAITAGAQASTSTSGAAAGASTGGKADKQAKSQYQKGMAIFTYIKGGLMYEASIGGQKFNFEPLKK